MKYEFELGPDEFEYLPNGRIKITSDFAMTQIAQYYEDTCTAEYIYDDYFDEMSEDEAREIGAEVRRLMRKCDESGELEQDTIERCIKEWREAKAE